jgi:Holliday junction resolvase RusA-like endonuclease
MGRGDSGLAGRDPLVVRHGARLLRRLLRSRDVGCEWVAVVIALVVPGVPAPQGSKTRNRYGGVREDNPATKPWRATITAAAADKMNGRPLLAGPLQLDVTFFFPRRKGDYGSGRNSGVLKPSAPVWKTSAPDTDKLVRAVCDAMKGVVYRDDAEISVIQARKLYGNHARVEICLSVPDERHVRAM